MKELSVSNKQTTLIDNDIFDLLSSVKWTAGYCKPIKSFYVMRTILRLDRASTEYIHHYVAGKPLRGFVIDHIDGNTLNNQRNNLRIVSRRGNMQNLLIHRKGKLCGAAFVKDKKRWRSSIKIAGRTRHLGYFNNETEANLAYLKEATRLENGK